LFLQKIAAVRVDELMEFRRINLTNALRGLLQGKANAVSWRSILDECEAADVVVQYEYASGEISTARICLVSVSPSNEDTCIACLHSRGQQFLKDESAIAKEVLSNRNSETTEISRGTEDPFLFYLEI